MPGGCAPHILLAKLFFFLDFRPQKKGHRPALTPWSPTTGRGPVVVEPRPPSRSFSIPLFFLQQQIKKKSNRRCRIYPNHVRHLVLPWLAVEGSREAREHGRGPTSCCPQRSRNHAFAGQTLGIEKHRPHSVCWSSWFGLVIVAISLSVTDYHFHEFRKASPKPLHLTLLNVTTTVTVWTPLSSHVCAQS